ncbi:glutathione S-transferase family protein [Gluconacetobacter tumulisoli]|uniref:glutathione transferase n=1 Tax=Gluconacetobacter tumulisoli TaxID=1286189 RepID=A0A7W4K530_9PROT|nr:glutathione S-transferase [Gluconacetobacter tumulisoli]MBB2200554.1 glutathione S-transferase [Gluconacetobacter tumulisoli]
MIIVHHLNNSRSQRVLWLLEELGLPYDIRFYQRDPKTMQAPQALRAIHPLGKSPVVVDGNTVIAESGAIITYIIETYGKGRLIPPAGTADRLRYTYWLHYAEGSAMPLLLMKGVFDMLPSQAPFFLRPVVRIIAGAVQARFLGPQLRLHMEYWTRELSTRAWFAGDAFTAADIQMSFPVETAAVRAGTGDAGPVLPAFLERIHARPAYRRAVERGGAYAYAA